MSKNLTRLAKKGKENNAPPKQKAPVVNKTVEKVETPIIKVKVPTTEETVLSIIDNIDVLTGKSDIEIVENVEETSSEAPTTMEKEATRWLQEQVELLTAENEQLRADLEQLNDYYNPNPNGPQNDLYKPTSTHNDSNVGVINLFNEIQTNLISMGINQQTGMPNLIIAPINFLNRMIAFFPFLENEKRFNF